MKDIDKTIANIDDVLEADALPKASPTQHFIGLPPHRVGEGSIEVQCADCDFHRPRLVKEISAVLFVDPEHEEYRTSAKEHTRETGHRVSFVLHIGNDLRVVSNFLQPKPSFWDRCLRF